MCMYLCSLMNSMDIYHCWARTEWWYAQISISKWKLPNSLGVRSLLVIVNVETLVQSLKARFIIRTSFMIPTNDSNACYVGNLYQQFVRSSTLRHLLNPQISDHLLTSIRICSFAFALCIICTWPHIVCCLFLRTWASSALCQFHGTFGDYKIRDNICFQQPNLANPIFLWEPSVFQKSVPNIVLA